MPPQAYWSFSAGILELFRRLHGGVHTAVHGAHGGEAAQESEGGAQESGDFHFGADMEKQGTDTGEEQRGLDAEGQAVALDQDRHQHRGAEHGEHVLETQDEHLGHAQRAGIPDGLLAHRGFLLFHVFSPLLFRQSSGKKNTGTNGRSSMGKIRKRENRRLAHSVLSKQHHAVPPFVILTYYTEMYDVLQVPFSMTLRQKRRQEL